MGKFGTQHRKHVTEIHHGQNLECWSHLSQLRFEYLYAILLIMDNPKLIYEK